MCVCMCMCVRRGKKGEGRGEKERREKRNRREREREFVIVVARSGGQSTISGFILMNGIVLLCDMVAHWPGVHQLGWGAQSAPGSLLFFLQLLQQLWFFFSTLLKINETMG